MMNFGSAGKRRLRSGRNWETALTLLEVMVVVVIMGMIAAIVSKVVVDRIEDARVQTARTQISEFAGALEMFYLDNSFYPTTAQGLEALRVKPTAGRVPAKYPERGHMPQIPLDPWGQEYVYVSPAANGQFEIICLGRDGVEGGEGYDADIRSSELAGKRNP